MAGAGAKAATKLGPKPLHRQVQQGGGIDKTPVYVPGCQNQRSSPGRAAGEGQKQHSPDTQTGALGGVQGPGGAEEGGGVFLALQQDAIRLKQRICPLHLRDVQGFTAQKGLPLVSGHVEAAHAAFGICPDKIRHGGVHGCSSPRAWATFIMMAHSIRFRNSWQPGS